MFYTKIPKKRVFLSYQSAQYPIKMSHLKYSVSLPSKQLFLSSPIVVVVVVDDNDNDNDNDDDDDDSKRCFLSSLRWNWSSQLQTHRRCRSQVHRSRYVSKMCIFLWRWFFHRKRKKMRKMRFEMQDLQWNGIFV